MPTNRRVQVGGVAPVEFRPGSSPVSTYVRSSAGTQLAQLAEGLSALAPSLGRFSDTLAQRSAARDKEEGEAAARRLVDEGKTYKQAVKDGVIAPHQSPWFRLGAQETFGRAAAEKFRGDLVLAMGQSGLSQETDIGKYDQFVHEYKAKWVAENLGDHQNPALVNSFGAVADNYTNQLRGNFAATAGAKLAQDSTDALGARVFSVALDGHTGDMSAESIAKVVTLDMDRAIAAGTNAREVNQAVVSGLVDAAKRTHDTRILDVLENLTTDKASGARLGATKEAREAAESARDYIAGEVHSEWVQSQQKTEAERQEAVRTVNTELTKTLLADPHADIRPFADKLVEMGEADAARSVFAIQGQIEDSLNPFDEEQVQGLQVDIYEGRVGVHDLLSMRANGTLNRQEFDYLLRASDDMQSKLDQARARQDQATARAQRAVMDDPAFKLDAWQQTESDMKGLFGAEEYMNSEAATRRRNGLFAARQMWHDYIYSADGAKAGYEAQAKKALEISEFVRKRYADDGGDAAPGNPEPASPKALRSLPVYQRKRVSRPENLDRLQAILSIPAARRRPWSPSEYAAFKLQGVKDPQDDTEMQQYLQIQRELQ